MTNLRPDFIVIGAMKSATTTLHEQLARQPGIFMTTPKEPNFFSDDDIFARGIRWYESLFAAGARADLRGESSTHYTKLPTYSRTLARICEYVPKAKFVYLMRHPIDRLVSHYIHDWTEGRIHVPIDVAVHRHPELVEYGRYAMQLRPYLETFGPARVLPVFFDRLRVMPQAELERVCAFIGYRGEPRWHRAVSHANASTDRMRKSPLRDAIVEQPLVRTLRHRLIPKVVRERVSDLWKMKNRPELSPNRRRQLVRWFDADLAELGTWLGVPLSCETFTELTAGRSFQWNTSAPGWRRHVRRMAA